MPKLIDKIMELEYEIKRRHSAEIRKRVKMGIIGFVAIGLISCLGYFSIRNSRSRESVVETTKVEEVKKPVYEMPVVEKEHVATYEKQIKKNTLSVPYVGSEKSKPLQEEHKKSEAQISSKTEKKSSSYYNPLKLMKDHNYNTQLSGIKRRFNNLSEMHKEEEKLLREMYKIFPGGEKGPIPVAEKECFNAFICNSMLEEIIQSGKKQGIDTTEAEQLDDQVDNKILYQFEDLFMFFARGMKKLRENEDFWKKNIDAEPNDISAYLKNYPWDTMYPTFLDYLHEMTEYRQKSGFNISSTKLNDHELFSALAKKLSEKAEKGEYRIRDARLKEDFYKKIEELAKK
ncbi:hypothetical protein HYU07_05030 [Candidatus Woesearchaeota archaeon]|nr:hypothetical protein [Candidatus Woesearchaeota archaeon]